MYLEDFSERLAVICPPVADGLRKVDGRAMAMLCGLLADFAQELLVSRPTRPGGAAEEARTPARMGKLLATIASYRTHGELNTTEALDLLDTELRAMGFLPPRHADAGGEP